MRNTEKFNPSSYLRRNLVLKTKCLSALCPYHYSYQKLKTKITESIVPKRATYETTNSPARKPTNSGTREPTNSRTQEPTNQEPRLCLKPTKQRTHQPEVNIL